MKPLTLSIKYFILIGIFFVAIVGTLLHFFYDWSGHYSLIRFFAPINESVWEHFKLGFYSLILYGFIVYPFIRQRVNNFLFGLAIASLALNAFIGIGYILYTQFSHHSIFVLDILLYISGIILCFLVLYKIITSDPLPPIFSWLGLLVILLTISCFIVFTINPPTQFELFKDPTRS